MTLVDLPVQLHIPPVRAHGPVAALLDATLCDLSQQASDIVDSRPGGGSEDSPDRAVREIELVDAVAGDDVPNAVPTDRDGPRLGRAREGFLERPLGG